MKLISLNTWGGKCFNPLIAFIKQHSPDTDIFCFQEMSDTKSDEKMCGDFRANLLSEIKMVIPKFKVFYFPVVNGFDFNANPFAYNLSFGQAMFVNNSIKVNSQCNYFVTKEKNFKVLKKDFSNLPSPLQYLCFSSNGENYHIFNFHGTPMPGDKQDTRKRLSEARKVKKIINSKIGHKILMGDFNLLPNTRSIKILENGMKNLIKEFNIQRTRSKSSLFFGKSNFQKFADYTLVSEGIKVKNFEVAKVEISDHLPMILEFS
ncbi:endonuclease/exonuclease/phosphatase family protein [Patescibacteria group bacterium]|nr:endonuclease/exonuclease/phosphatase family protein [Patescibacteria group bacterium]